MDKIIWQNVEFKVIKKEYNDIFIFYIGNIYQVVSDKDQIRGLRQCILELSQAPKENINGKKRI